MTNESKPDTEYEVEDVRLSQLEEGDRILFAGRKTPCVVTKAELYDSIPTMSVGNFRVETPHGKARRISKAKTAGVNPALETDKCYESTDPSSTSFNCTYFNRIWRVVDE